MKSFLLLLLASTTTSICSAAPLELIDRELSKFNIWLGVPHTTVKGLPEDTHVCDRGKQGTPLGVTPTSKTIFTTTEENGEIILNISGEIYAALTSKAEFENYHLSTQFKWGEKKWEPRLNAKRDSGIIYHCYGEEAAFWNVWKTGLEYQVQESDMGDFISLSGNSAQPKRPGPKADIYGDTTTNAKGKTTRTHNPSSNQLLPYGGYVNASADIESPHGEWNQLDIWVLGSSAIHSVNGQIVLVLQNARLPDDTPLTKGQIQIQSEGAECSYKNLTIEFISQFPPSLQTHIK